jgi:glutathionyl-hydroquinone reductase
MSDCICTCICICLFDPACLQWCHRARLVIAVLGLTKAEVTVTQLVDDPVKASRGGWVFSPQQPDPLFGCRDLRELYDKLSPTGAFQGRCTAPLLVDKISKRAVSNESSDIVRMLNAATFQRKDDTPKPFNLYPPDLALEIDSTNEWVYRLLNNGVYRCGFSTTQPAYDEASRDVTTLRRDSEQARLSLWVSIHRSRLALATDHFEI